MEKINCIMLVDDNKVDNFYHERVIRRNNAAEHVITAESAREALDYLAGRAQNPAQLHPDVIFLDINMPGMNGWEFLDEYKKLDDNQQSKMVVVMLTTSENPDDMAKARTKGILADFKTKPLTINMLEEILSRFHQQDSE